MGGGKGAGPPEVWYMSPTRLKAPHICSVVIRPFSTSSSLNLVRHAALDAGSLSCTRLRPCMYLYH